MSINVPTMLACLTALSSAAACANASSDPPGSSPDGTRYEANATVLDDGTGPVLCLGGVAESSPPQCDGIPLDDWSWDAVDGEQTASGVTWGEFHVIGTYDDTSFTVERAGQPEAVPPDDGDPFATPCPEPADGWTNSGPATTDKDLNAAMRVAEGIPAFAGLWIDSQEPVGFAEPGPVILNVAFTGDPESHEQVLRDAWDGPLCLISFEHTYRELQRTQDDLSEGGAEDAGLELLSSSVNVMTNQVEIGVVVTTTEAERALDEAYGAGTIRVLPALFPV
jgi:hypothetical protein